MAATPPKLETVQQHADGIMAKVLADRGVGIEDTEAARQAASVPAFSAGTAALDADGKPIVPKRQATLPEFTEGATVAVPEADGSAKIAAPEAPTSKEAILAAHQARLEEATPAPPAEAAAAQATGAAVADEAAAGIAADVWAKTVDFDFDDPDHEGMKIPVRVPEQFLPIAKAGYGRRSAYDRAIRYLKDADPTLRPLIEDGRLQQMLPLIKAALDDPQGFGEYVYQGYQRKTQGLPLIEAARVEAAAAAAPTVAAATALPTQAEFARLEEENPFFAEQLRPFMQAQAATNQRLETLQQRLDREDAQRTEAQTRQAHSQQQQRQNNQQLSEAHRDLAAMYAGQYNPTAQINDPMFKRAFDYAREAGYHQAYGLKAGTIFGAQQIAIMEQERLEATGSPAAAALAQVEQRNGALARTEAAAASRTVGGGAPLRATPPPPPQRPTTMNVDGTMKAPAQYRDEMAVWLAANQVTA